MKATLTLRRNVWNSGLRTRTINQALGENAVELEDDLRAYIDNSEPQGKIRRIASITSRRSARGVGRLRRGSTTRSVTGSEIYRASAPGQPPAKRTGRLYRAIKVRRKGNSSIKASVDVKYAKYLDNPNILNRPFFKNRCRLYFRERFKPSFRAAVNRLITNV